jgi:hypothetical protein
VVADREPLTLSEGDGAWLSVGLAVIVAEVDGLADTVAVDCKLADADPVLLSDTEGDAT